MWHSEDRGRELLSSALVKYVWWGAGRGERWGSKNEVSLGAKQWSGKT